MFWKLLIQSLPILWAIFKWLINRADNRKMREVAREEMDKRLKAERRARLLDRADASLDDRRKRAGGLPDDPDAD